MDQRPKPVTGYPVPGQPPVQPTVGGVPAHGTAYPYPAPPYYPAPPPPPAAPYYQPQNSDYSTFLRRLIIIAIVVFFVVALSVFITWLVVRPRIPDFAVSSATVSSLNVSTGSQQISADFNLIISVRNPNKRVGVFYDRLDGVVLYGSTQISETSLAPFYQEKGDSRDLRVSFSAVGTLAGGDVTSSILKERSSDSRAVVFRATFIGWINFRSGFWRTRRHFMTVHCDNIKFGFSNATAGVGTFAGPPQQCGVHI